MDRFAIEIGIVCCSLSGLGIGERVKISRLDAYEINPASRKQIVSPRRVDGSRNQSTHAATSGGAS